MVRSHALAPGGSIGLMVYGALGRRGVYEAQAMLRLLHAAGNATDGADATDAADATHFADAPHFADGADGAAQPPEDNQGLRSLRTPDRAPDGRPGPKGPRPWPIRARVADAVELIASLPASSSLRRNGPVWRSDEMRLKMGDAGVFDLLLHSTDQPYTRPRLVAMARAAGLAASGWLHPGLYDPRYWLRPCSGAFGPCEEGPSTEPNRPRELLRRQLASLDVESAAEFAELASGHARKHWVYLSRKGRTEDSPVALGTSGTATGMEADLAPCALNISQSTMVALSARRAQPFSVQTLLQGEPMVMRMPPLTSDLLARIDCQTPLADVLGSLPVRAEDAWAQWRQLYDQLNAVGGWLFMVDFHVREES
jgi:hypothetical protein